MRKITVTKRIDQNGQRLYRHLQRNGDGTWGVKVCAGTVPLMTTLARYVYRTRAQARDADIQDGCRRDRRGWVRAEPYDAHLTQAGDDRD